MIKRYEYSISSAGNHDWNEPDMGAPVSIVLQRNERKRYEQLCRSGKTPVRLKERLTIVLLADDGLNNGEIAERMSISAHMAGRWRKRFSEQGLSGIEKNLPRGNNHGGKSTRARRGFVRRLLRKQRWRNHPMQLIGAQGRWQRYWEPVITLLRKSGENVASSHI